MFAVLVAMVWSLQTDVKLYKAALEKYRQEKYEETGHCYKDAVPGHLLTFLVENITATLSKDLETLLEKQRSSTKVDWNHCQIRDQTFSSCADVLKSLPAASSGHYFIRKNNSRPVHVYCDMTLSCNGKTGGWRRVVYWNKNEPGTKCPSGFDHRANPSSCIRNVVGPGCSSVNLDNWGLSYTSVCGRIHAFHFNSLDGFDKYLRPINATIENNYVDGVSLTYGMVDERNHVWSFVATTCENTLSSKNTPEFVEDNYSWDKGSLTDLLWDDVQCTRSPNGNNPWFYRKLNEETCSNLEARVCRDQDRADEDVLLNYLEIYVQ